MAEEGDPVEAERLLLVSCINTAYDSLRVMPGFDANGPALVWFADHLLATRHRAGEGDKGALAADVPA
jgi:hypothetical protein